jgi:hypothetical protein
MLTIQEKKQAVQLKKIALDKLSSHGIQDKFTVKIKPVQKNWVAQYRGKSQFSSGGSIFWLSSELLNNPDEFVISVLHEYGHVIAEFAWMQSPDLSQLIQDNWKGEFHGRPWNEENFAEEFAQYLAGRFCSSKEILNQVIVQFIKDALT